MLRQLGSPFIHSPTPWPGDPNKAPFFPTSVPSWSYHGFKSQGIPNMESQNSLNKVHFLSPFFGPKPNEFSKTFMPFTKAATPGSPTSPSLNSSRSSNFIPGYSQRLMEEIRDQLTSWYGKYPIIYAGFGISCQVVVGLGISEPSTVVYIFIKSQSLFVFLIMFLFNHVFIRNSVAARTREHGQTFEMFYFVNLTHQHSIFKPNNTHTHPAWMCPGWQEIEKFWNQTSWTPTSLRLFLQYPSKIC